MESNVEEAINKKNSKKSMLIRLLIVGFVGIFLGVSLGIYYNSQRLDPNRYNFNVAELTDDVKPIKSEAQTKTPVELGAIKCCVLAFDTTFSCEKVEIIGVGLVKAMGVNQTINAKTVRNGDKIFTENVSVSKFAKALNRYYFTNNELKHYTGTLNGKTITWKTEADNIGGGAIKTMQEYKSKYGSTLNEYMTYIVSSKTVISESPVTKDEDGNYVFTLTLDKSKSVVNYVKTMKDTGGLIDYPNFTSNPEITVTMDSNYRILKFVSKENYSVNVGITAKSVGTLTNTFNYDEDFVIPALTDTTTI